MVDDARATVPQQRARPQDDADERRRARRVTWGAVVVLLVVAAVELELWPLTAYRLFSDVRTSGSSTTELVAVAPDGHETPVRLDRRNPVVVTTGRQYGALPGAALARQRAMVRAWLDAADIDPADVAEVRLERVALEMDPRTRERRETSREVLVVVTP